MTKTLCALLSAIALALPARAEDPPALELAPLVPPKAPWLKKNQTEADAKKADAKKAPGPQAKKAKRKKGAPAQLEVQPGAPFVAAPPKALPALPPPAVAQPQMSAAELPLPPLIQAPSAPAITLSSVGVLLQNDGLDAASAARVDEGLRGVVEAAPLTRLGPVLARPVKPCTDDACLISQAAVQTMDQLLVATYATGGLRLRLLDVASKKALAEASQATVAREPQEAAAWAEALACKILVPAGCSGEVSVDASEGVQLELDGKPLLRGEKRLVPVGVHQLTARAGGKVAQRALPVSREGALALSTRQVDGELRLLAPGETQPVAQPLAVQSAPRLATAAAPSAPRRWTRPAGLATLGAFAAVTVAGIYFGAKSHSDLNHAESSFRTNGGAYRSGDLAALNSGNSAAHTANALFIASGVLLAAGALLTWAF